MITRLLLSTFIFTSIIRPFEVIDSTSQFISLLFTKRPTKASHIANLFTLSIGFIVVYHLIAIRTIIEFYTSSNAPLSVHHHHQNNVAENTYITKPIKENNDVKDTIKNEEPIKKEEIAREEKTITREEKPIQEKDIIEKKEPIEEKEIKREEEPIKEREITREEEPIEEKEIKREEEPIKERKITREKEPIEEKLSTINLNQQEPILKDQFTSQEPVVIVKEDTTPLVSTPIDKDQTIKENKVAHVDEPVVPTTPENSVPDNSGMREQYYNELLNKENNMMSLSDNLQRIFDESSLLSGDENNNNSKLDDVPALTPPHPSSSSAAGSTLSRKSSLASQHSQFKSRLQIAMQKVAKSGPKTEENNTKKRFSTIRLSKRKSKIMDSDTNIQPEENIVPKKSISTKFQKGLKNTGKRFSKIFS